MSSIGYSADRRLGRANRPMPARVAAGDAAIVKEAVDCYRSIRFKVEGRGSDQGANNGVSCLGPPTRFESARLRDRDVFVPERLKI